MTAQQQLVQNAIARGWVKPPDPDAPHPKSTTKVRAWQARVFSANLARGLTSLGKPRQRAYSRRVKLKGWTPEQKRERKKQTMKEWRKRREQRGLGNVTGMV